MHESVYVTECRTPHALHSHIIAAFYFSVAAQHLSRPTCDDSLNAPNAPYQFTTIQHSLVRVSVYTFHAMSHYYYPPLSRGSDIRLLRLMPHNNETAPIQCELFEYSFQESTKGTHLYEALSYVWGSLEPPRFISIDKHNLRVTENLHKALSHLRNPSLV